MRKWFVMAALFSFLAAASPLAPAEAAPQRPADAARAVDRAAAGKIDINRAGIEELMSVPGIGPALARRIVEHRDKNGPFRSVDELVAVKGIGPKLLEKIRDRLTVGKKEGKRS